MMKDMMMKNKIYIMPTQSLYIGYVWLHFEGEVSCNHTKPPVPTRNPRGWQKILTSSIIEQQFQYELSARGAERDFET